VIASPSRPMSRRSLLRSAALYACATRFMGASHSEAQAPGVPSLKSLAQRSGRQTGVFGGAYLPSQPDRAQVVAREFSMIADGNDLKFSDRLRPTPSTYNFGPGDIALDWARTNGLLFRGHCLVWWNALPKWFQSNVTPTNAKQIMVDHITTVVRHYAGHVYSWDVVNEAIYHDDRPDGLRRKPWLDLIGPEYIDIAFQTAAAADPKARLVLNECYIEHDTPAEISRRASLLALAKRLKTAKVPLNAIGIQSHLRGNTPIDKPGMMTFLTQVQALGLEIQITELDVDDVGVPGPMIDAVVAQKYREYLDLIGPFASLISFQDVADSPGLPKRPDGLASRPDLFDAHYQQKPSYKAVTQALDHLPKRS
jgi:endo-1,4-beta-xylanase